MIDYSRERALKILDSYVEEVALKYPNDIVSILLVGSLTNDTYIEGPGRDIDQITVLNSDTPQETFDEILGIIRDINNSNRKELLLSENIYYTDELCKPYKSDFEFDVSNKRLLEVPVELLRVFDSGRVIYGNKHMIQELEPPDKEDVILFDELSLKWKIRYGSTIQETMEAISSVSPRIEVQILLTSAMSHYYYETGKSCSNKHAIAKQMTNEVPGYAFQDAINLATAIKLNINDELQLGVIKQVRDDCRSMLEWCRSNPVGKVPKVET